MPTWDLPWLRGQSGPKARLLGDWNTTFILSLASGTPINIVAAQNNTFTCQGCTIRPNWTGQPMTIDNWRDDPNLIYINGAAFSQPADGTYGNLGRNTIRWPATRNVDLNVTKSFRLYGENVRLDLKFDFFNLFNWVNWNSPEAITLGGNPSVIYSMQNRSGAPRTMQLGARISF